MMKMTARSLTLLVALVLPVEVLAQVPPTTQYRLTRQTPTVATHIFPRTAMTCGLPRAVPSSIGLRIEDPANAALDCELLGTAGGVIISGASTYTIAAGSADGLWSNESAMTGIVPPPSPSLPRVRPGAIMVSAEGTVGDRFPFSGLDVVNVGLDLGITVAFGAPTLTVPGYNVQRGDRFLVAFWR